MENLAIAIPVSKEHAQYLPRGYPCGQIEPGIPSISIFPVTNSSQISKQLHIPIFLSVWGELEAGSTLLLDLNAVNSYFYVPAKEGISSTK